MMWDIQDLPNKYIHSHLAQASTKTKLIDNNKVKTRTYDMHKDRKF